jgi:hypothetical protein
MSGLDEINPDFFDWKLNEGAPTKIECLNKVDEDGNSVLGMPYFPWGCWGCHHFRWREIEHPRGRKRQRHGLGMVNSDRIGECGNGHPTFYYRGFRVNNTTATNRMYHTMYRTAGDVL